MMIYLNKIMNTEKLNQYASYVKIKLHYLKDFMLCAEGDNWAFKSEASLRNFVLSRQAGNERI